MGWCNWTKEQKRHFDRQVGDGSQTKMQLYNVLLIYLWTSELHRSLGAYIVGSRKRLMIWNRWLTLLIHLTKTFHISQKLTEWARMGDMKTGESGESCNYQENKKKTTRKSDQETGRAGTEVKYFQHLFASFWDQSKIQRCIICTRKILP